MINNIFKIVSRLSLTTFKYSQTVNATRKNTSYLKPKNPDSFGCKNGKNINAAEKNTKVVISQSR